MKDYRTYEEIKSDNRFKRRIAFCEYAMVFIAGGVFALLIALVTLKMNLW